DLGERGQIGRHVRDRFGGRGRRGRALQLFPRRAPLRGGFLLRELRALRGAFFQIGDDLLGEDRRIAAVGSLGGAAFAPPREQAAALFFRRALRGEDRDGQRADVRGRRDHAQRGGERRVVGRRQQRRHEYQVGHTVANRFERVLGGVGEDQLRPDLVADH